MRCYRAWSNSFWPGLTPFFGPLLWQADADADTVCFTYCSSSGPKGVGSGENSTVLKVVMIFSVQAAAQEETEELRRILAEGETEFKFPEEDSDLSGLVH